MEGSGIWRNQTGPTAVICDALQVWFHAWAASMDGQAQAALAGDPPAGEDLRMQGCKYVWMARPRRRLLQHPRGSAPLSGRNNCDSPGVLRKLGKWEKWGKRGSIPTPPTSPLSPLVPTLPSFPTSPTYGTPRGITVVAAA